MGRLQKLPWAALMSLLSSSFFLRAQVSTLHIRPQTCRNVIGRIGTCMFVWECIKTEGKHLGTCVDGFLFGSCCAHNESTNIVSGASTSNVVLERWSTSKPTTTKLTTTSSTIISKVPHWQTPTTALFSRTPAGGHISSLSTRRTTPHFHPTHPSSLSTYISSTTRKPYVSTLSTRDPSGPSYPAWTFSGYRPTSGAIQSTTKKPLSTFKPTERPYFPPRPSWEPHKTSTYYGFASRWTTRPTTPSTSALTNKSTTTEKGTSFLQPESTTASSLRPQGTLTSTIVSANIVEALASFSTTTIPTAETTLNQQSTKPTIVFTNSTAGSTETMAPTTTSTKPPVTNRNTWRPVIVTASRPSWSLPQVSSTPISAIVPAITASPASAKPSLTPCGIQNPHPQKKVVGGKNSAFGSWPWQASVRRTSFFGFSSTHRCGGALISSQWIATAGHCVDDLLLSQIKIRVGEYDFASVQEPHGYLERGVKRKVVHPRYNFFTYENDLALVQLEEVIDAIKYPHIAPICLPPSEEDLVGKNATVTGWGRLSEGGVLPSILQEVQVPIISNEKCKNMFLAAGRHEYIPEIFMCAGFEKGGRDSCQGDSGGPLQIQGDDGYWFLAGIISWGIGCAEPNMPGVCTRISKFKDWVLQNIT